MVSKILQANDIYYCSNCRMRQPDLHPYCNFCGSEFSNYEELMIKQENDTIRPMFDLDKISKNKYAREDEV